MSVKLIAQVPPHKRDRLADCYVEHPGRPAGEALINVSNTPEQESYIGAAPPVMSSGGGGLVATMHDYARFCQVPRCPLPKNRAHCMVFDVLCLVLDGL